MTKESEKPLGARQVWTNLRVSFPLPGYKLTLASRLTRQRFKPTSEREGRNSSPLARGETGPPLRRQLVNTVNEALCKVEV